MRILKFAESLIKHQQDFPEDVIENIYEYTYVSEQCLHMFHVGVDLELSSVLEADQQAAWMRKQHSRRILQDSISSRRETALCRNMSRQERIMITTLMKMTTNDKCGPQF